MKNFVLLLVVILVCYNPANAQLFSGRVTCHDDGEPAIRASVYVKGTNIGTRTDIDGYYQLEIDSTHTTLYYAYIGYISKEIKINNDSIINVSLEKADIVLDEFKITAYVERIKSKIIVDRIDTTTVYTSKAHKFFKLNGRKETYPVFSSIGKNDRKLLRIEKEWIRTSMINRDTLLKHIYDNINYPDSSIYYGVEGRISVRFMIDSEGNIKDTEVLRNLDNWTKLNVLSVFQSAPKLSQYKINEWKAGKPKDYIGIFILPIFFRIEDG
jgi:hypothetical protein